MLALAHGSLSPPESGPSWPQPWWIKLTAASVKVLQAQNQGRSAVSRGVASTACCHRCSKLSLSLDKGVECCLWLRQRMRVLKDFCRPPSNLAWMARDKGQFQTTSVLFGQLEGGLGLALPLVPLPFGPDPATVASQCWPCSFGL